MPVFLLIVLGFVLKRSLMRLETQWHGLERLTYFVLLPRARLSAAVERELKETFDAVVEKHRAN